MDKNNSRYAALLGCRVRTDWFDGGCTVSITYGKGVDAVTWRGSYCYGDEDRFNRRVTLWLHTLPWPQEDDPRVEHEGATL